MQPVKISILYSKKLEKESQASQQEPSSRVENKRASVMQKNETPSQVRRHRGDLCKRRKLSTLPPRVENTLFRSIKWRTNITHRLAIILRIESPKNELKARKKLKEKVTKEVYFVDAILERKLHTTVSSRGTLVDAYSIKWVTYEEETW
jgi:hypothetical protein